MTADRRFELLDEDSWAQIPAIADVVAEEVEALASVRDDDT